MRFAAAVVLALTVQGAVAHDTWFAPSRAPAPGQVKLELSTGNRFPVQETSPGAASLIAAECIDSKGARAKLQPAEVSPRWLDLRVRDAGAVSCWAELKPFEIELQPKIVDVYLDEIHAPAAVRDAWARMQAKGLAWRESYRKFARVELDPLLAAARKPAGLALELVVLGDAPLRAGVAIEFQLLRDGVPLAGFPIELASERSKLGIWRETDAEGKLRHVLPFAGRWLLRGTDVRPADDGERWTSRFVTLALELR